ncbi:hypothetical protein GCM10020367_67970 [Streptomyces sannanensis]|uniref:DNA ligase ATP-dependent N-terminal domain-containing protein n=1 Tax=Streptomyces sannanensis TaxID=285536 RepID=A0ABP6SNV2_9ACTN
MRTSPWSISYLAGRLPQGRLGVGWSVLGEPVAPAGRPALTVTDVDAALSALAGVGGAGAQAERRRRVRALSGAATAGEQEFLLRLLSGEVRQGALDAIALEGVAAASGVPADELRRAVMLDGSLPRVVRVRPELVVEIAYNGLQRSPRYPARCDTALRPRGAAPPGQGRAGG